MLHVLVGAKQDIPLVLGAAKSGRAAPWIVPKKAEPNDRVVIHLPGKGFTARGFIGTKPKRDSSGDYGADVKAITLLAYAVPLAFVRKNHRSWKWPLIARHYTTIDGAIERRLNELLDNYQTSLREPITEGTAKIVSVTVYERDPIARQRCIEHYGIVCFACGFSFGEKYGELADGYIHVHHLKAIAGRGKHTVNPIRDLRPICPNCHAVIHLSDPPLSIAELKRLLKQ